MHARPALVALVTWALVACGTAAGTDPAPSQEVTAVDSPVRIVEDKKADLVLWVSNQSFDDEEVRLKVEVDGITVVDADFHVEGQHNWIRFPLEMPAGEHEITAESDSGATLRETFEVPGDRARYAVIDHWGEDESADLSWRFQRQPVAFA